MTDPANQSWSDALALYGTLDVSRWPHIAAFRDLVVALSAIPEAAGLTAVTSMDTLIVSPYTCYPDWFEGRHVKLHPLKGGLVRIESVPQRFDKRPTETWTVPLSEALDKIRGLLADL